MSYEWPDEDAPEEDFPGEESEGFDGRAALGGGAAYLAASPLLAPLANIPHQRYEALAAKRPMTSPAMTPLQELAEFTKAEVRAISDFAKKRGVTAPILSAGPDALSSYVQVRPLAGKIDHIGLGRASVPSAMHEIGHASSIAGSKGLRDMSFLASAMARGLPGQLLRGALAGNILRGKQEGDSALRSAAYEHAPALMGATYAPMLLEEARATGHAVKGGRSIGKGMATLKDLAPGYGTYVARAMTPVLGALLAKKVVESIRGKNKKKHEKKAAIAGAEVKAPGLLRVGASAAWRMRPPAAKPKSIKPTTGTTPRAKETTKLKPPSTAAYQKDLIKSLHNPQRGFRIAKVG